MLQIRLDTARQFYMEDVVLSETSLAAEDPDVLKKTEAYCVEKVEALLEKAGRYIWVVAMKIFNVGTGMCCTYVKRIIRIRIVGND